VQHLQLQAADVQLLLLLVDVQLQLHPVADAAKSLPQ
jgi:hypothetical protein